MRIPVLGRDRDETLEADRLAHEDRCNAARRDHSVDDEDVVDPAGKQYSQMRRGPVARSTTIF